MNYVNQTMIGLGVLINQNLFQEELNHHSQ